MTIPPAPALIVLSHLRWHFVFQRPQHLMTRAARDRAVYYIEEPIFGDWQDHLSCQADPSGVLVCTPHIQIGHSPAASQARTAQLVCGLVAERQLREYDLWVYTPMEYPVAAGLHPSVTVYDCMDELANFKDAPPELREREQQLFAQADVVFTGGQRLYEAKSQQHPNVHAFPSSVDVSHFARARRGLPDPADQRDLARPRLGFYGVIDERFDIDLVGELARRQPEWQFVLVGPVVKIDPARLPRGKNLHYLGQKSYAELPDYLAHWDIALLPFALNASTEFISPTKTPEYLAAGVAVVSTGIRDVIEPYGVSGMVHIADGADAFERACLETLAEAGTPAAQQRQARAEHHLATLSWDLTWQAMCGEMEAARRRKGQSLGAAKGVSEATAFDYLIVGAGFAGAVLAERLSSVGKRVVVVDKRPHIGGNAYDCYDDAGVLIHPYGPHIFHTNSAGVFEYLSQFTQWRPYQHRVLANVDGQTLPIPINLDTVNRLYGLSMTSFELEDFFASVAEHPQQITTSEDVVVSKVGRDLYNKFFRGYTRKQWGLDPSQLDASVTARVPTRTNRDDRYFTDRFQAMPLHGYTRMFQNMLSHPNIKVMLNTDYREIMGLIPYGHLIYTGPVDAYFNHCYGPLPYRSLEFRHETHGCEQLLPVGTVNYPNDYAFTRVSEFKHITGQKHHQTSVVYEFPQAEGDPYYPVPRPENAELYKRYEALAAAEPEVTFVGRLATYRYYNMDQVVAQALSTFRRLQGEKV